MLGYCAGHEKDMDRVGHDCSREASIDIRLLMLFVSSLRTKRVSHVIIQAPRSFASYRMHLPGRYHEADFV